MKISITKIHDTVTPQLLGLIRAFNEDSKRKILLKLGQSFNKQTKENFGTNGKYRDKTWPRLSKAYSKKIGSSVPTLKRSGNLYNSIIISAPRNNYIEIYTNNKYAAAQVFGNKNNNLPPRNFFPVQFSTPNYSRLVFNAEKELNAIILNQMKILSGGALSSTTNIKRSGFEYGNPFSRAN